MRCERFRDAVSARLDGEPLGTSSSGLDEHLTVCADCARWAEGAAQVTRLARMDVRPVPDLSEQITVQVALPARRVARRRRWLRFALVLAGIVQLAIGLPAVTGDSIGMAMAAHAAHEAAAWNIAIGIAFLGAALVPRRAAGLVPLLSTFLVVLGVLSVHDLLDGAVTVARLATHLGVLVGLVLLLALDRAERALPPGTLSGARSDDLGGETALRTVA